jgi:magnesium-transporting ATPase (P-type)
MATSGTLRSSTEGSGGLWHALEAGEAVERLGTGPEGLPGSEAAARLDEHGPNALETEEPTSSFVLLLRQFRSPLIGILLVAAVVTVLIHEYVDTAVIVAVLVLNAAVGFTQERKADRSVRSLMQLAAPRSEVVRDGRRQELDSTLLVPGDLVLLESGTRVPADLRLVAVTALRIDESLLTGESLPADKSTAPVAPSSLAADRRCMAHMGSVVASGRGRGVVTATGLGTELGQISEQLRAEETPETPLTARMHRFANVIAAAVAVSASATFLLGWVLGEPAGQMFMTAVALAVAVVPEGLPVALTVAMALGVRRMAHRNAIVRSLPAVETLGSTNTIGSDKTGTLTENRMTVQRVWAGGTTYRLEDEGGVGAARPLADALADLALRRTLEAGVLTNEAELRRTPEGEVETTGDPTEAALLVAAERADMDVVALRRAHRCLTEVPFEPDLRYSLALRSAPDGPVRMWVKGAPERIVELSTGSLAADGRLGPLDPEAVLAAGHELAARGLRVLAMAYRDVEEDGSEDVEPGDLVLVGLQGMLDPPRRGVREAIAGCEDAGIRVVMITGDHATTARAIALDLGLIDTPAAPVLTGQELEVLGEDALARQVMDVRVFARVSPDHKHRIVKALQQHGQIVAVTGDGVNDGPALRAADIGIAMGRSGTDVAREASDMVLADDDFVSIYHAVREGRVVFDNVRKVTFFLLSTGFAAVAALLYSLGVGLPLPLLPAQLLWLNVVTNGLQDVALAFEPPEAGVLRRRPRPRGEPVVSRLLWERTAFTGLTMAIASMVMFHWSLRAGSELAEARSVALTTLVVCMAFHVFNARSEQQSVFRMNPLGNPFLLAATTGALAIHALALQWGPTQFVLRLAPLDLTAWLRIVAIASSVLVVSEVHKRLRRGGSEVPRGPGPSA